MPFTVLLAAFLLVFPLNAGAQVSQPPARSQSAPVMSAADAHKKALNGELVLIDIRSPGEWRETGVAASAVTITMHQRAPSFFTQLEAATGNRKSLPIALICATGSRTAYLQKALGSYGYTSVINVAEGMLGSRFGRGWIKAGLPIKKTAR